MMKDYFNKSWCTCLFCTGCSAGHSWSAQYSYTTKKITQRNCPHTYQITLHFIAYLIEVVLSINAFLYLSECCDTSITYIDRTFSAFSAWCKQWLKYHEIAGPKVPHKMMHFKWPHEILQITPPCMNWKINCCRYTVGLFYLPNTTAIN